MIEEVVVTIRKRLPDGSIGSEEVPGWTTKCPQLVITRGESGYLLTHSRSGCAVINNVGNEFPDLLRLADQLDRFDWSREDLYESKPDDWGERFEVVKSWYFGHDDQADDSAGPFGEVRA